MPRVPSGKGKSGSGSAPAQIGAAGRVSVDYAVFIQLHTTGTGASRGRVKGQVQQGDSVTITGGGFTWTGTITRRVGAPTNNTWQADVSFPHPAPPRVSIRADAAISITVTNQTNPNDHQTVQDTSDLIP